jgi:hypothetical protein
MSDPFGIVALVIVAYLLLQKNSGSTAASAGTVASTGTQQTGLANLLAGLLNPTSSSAQKSTSGGSSGGGASGGGAPSSQSGPGQTPTLNQSAGNPAEAGLTDDAQGAAELQALEDGNIDLYNAIYGVNDPEQLENDPDPTVTTALIADVPDPVYDPAPVTFDPTDPGDPSQVEVPYTGGGDYGDVVDPTDEESYDYGGDDGGDSGD